MKIKLIATCSLVVGLILTSVTGAVAARSQLRTINATSPTLTNNCEVSTSERLNNNANTAPGCYGLSQIRGNFANSSDIDWVRHYPLTNGTQNVYIYTTGKTKVNLFRGNRLVARGFTNTRGWIRLNTAVEVNVPGQNILGVQLSGNTGVNYTVYFPEVIRSQN